MGLHLSNMELVGKCIIDPDKPQIVLYEPTADGRLKLTGADFLADAQQWDSDKTLKPGPPELMGQLFHYFESPNRFGLKAFYTLHVWAWKENPQRRVRKLALCSFVQVIQRPNLLSRDDLRAYGHQVNRAKNT